MYILAITISQLLLHHNLVRLSPIHNELNAFLILSLSLLCSRKRLYALLCILLESHVRQIMLLYSYPLHLIFLAMNASAL